MRSGQVLSKLCLIVSMMISIFMLKSEVWRYCGSSGLVVWNIILFTTISDCCVSRGIYLIPICLFLALFIMCCPFFKTKSYCLSIVMINP